MPDIYAMQISVWDSDYDVTFVYETSRIIIHNLLAIYV